MDSHIARNVLVGFAALIVASGCAGNSGSRRADTAGVYREDLERAEASVAAADKAGAYEQAAADLDRARQKLSAARKAVDEGDDVVAQRLAIEANLDAEVALATARNQEMQAAVTEQQESLRALEDETRRSEQRDLGRP